MGAEGSGEVAQASGTPKPVRVGLRKRKPAEGGAAAAGGAGPRAAPSTLVKVKSPKAAVRGCGSEVGTLDDEAGDGDEEPCSDWSSESVAGKSLSEFLVTQDQARFALPCCLGSFAALGFALMLKWRWQAGGLRARASVG